MVLGRPFPKFCKSPCADAGAFRTAFYGASNHCGLGEGAWFEECMAEASKTDENLENEPGGVNSMSIRLWS